MLKSFTYMFKEDSFVKKFFMLFAFVFVANFFTNLAGVIAPIMGKISIWYNITIIFGYIFMFVPYGYSIDLLKANLENNVNSNILDLDIFNNFKEGFKVVLSALILLIILAIVLFGLGFASKLFAQQFGGFGSSFIYTFVFLIALIMSFLGIAMCCRYVVKPSWFNFVNIPAAFKLINNDVAKYFKVYLLTALLAILLVVITILLLVVTTQIGFVGFVLYNLVISLIWSYLIFVLAKLFSYSVETAKI